MNDLSPGDIRTIDNQPRLQDLSIAVALDMESSSDAIVLIEAQRAALETHGPIVVDDRAVYWLNEGQALLACILSNRPEADSARASIAAAFDGWRRRQPGHVRMTMAGPGRYHIDAVLDGSIATEWLRALPEGAL